MVASSPVTFDDHSTLVSPPQESHQPPQTPSSAAHLTVQQQQQQQQAMAHEIGVYGPAWGPLIDYENNPRNLDPSMSPRADSPTFQRIIGQVSSSI